MSDAENDFLYLTISQSTRNDCVSDSYAIYVAGNNVRIIGKNKPSKPQQRHGVYGFRFPLEYLIAPSCLTADNRQDGLATVSERPMRPNVQAFTLLPRTRCYRLAVKMTMRSKVTLDRMDDPAEPILRSYPRTTTSGSRLSSSMKKAALSLSQCRLGGTTLWSMKISLAADV